MAAIGEMSCGINLLLMNSVQIVHQGSCIIASAAPIMAQQRLIEELLQSCGHALT